VVVVQQVEQMLLLPLLQAKGRGAGAQVWMW